MVWYPGGNSQHRHMNATISAAELQTAFGISITASAGTVVAINVPEQTVAIKSLAWAYLGGVQRSTAILNLYGAQVVELSGGTHEVCIFCGVSDV